MSSNKPLKLPRSIPVPGGRIPVRLVSDKRMVEIAGELVEGFWQEVNTTIYIRKALSLEERVEVFWHEMPHMCTDMEWDARIKKEKECVFTSQAPSASGTAPPTSPTP